jgi:DNA invertase Pin-like site-specific DNA recombinase
VSAKLTADIAARVVVAYERVSTASQDIARQAVQRERAERDYPGMEIVRIADDGVSAYKVPIFDRPGGRRLCGLIEAGRVEALYVDAQDRLTRGDDWEWVRFRLMCEAQHVRVVIDGREMRNDLGGKVEGYLKAMLAQQESVEKSHRVRSGKAASARKGRHNGGPRPYGYDRGEGPGDLVVVEHERAVLLRMAAEFIAGKSQSRIAANLNADGITTVKGKRWNQPQVSAHLHKPLYRGKVVNRGELFDGNHAPIYAADVVAQLDALLAPGAAPTLRGRRPHRHLLINGMLRCTCGAAMRARTDAKQYGPWEAYICDGRHSGQTECAESAFQRAAIDSTVFEWFLRAGHDLDGMAQRVAEARDAEVAEVRARAAFAGREVMQKEAQLAKVEADYLGGDLSPARYNNLSDKLGADLEAVRAEAARLERHSEAVGNGASVADAEAEALVKLARMRRQVVGRARAAGVIDGRGRFRPLWVSAPPHDLIDEVRAVLAQVVDHFALQRDPLADLDTLAPDEEPNWSLALGPQDEAGAWPTFGDYVLQPVLRAGIADGARVAFAVDPAEKNTASAR